ncbi:MAG: glycosyltransferase family 2 protein [Bacteroidota bacterium]
MKIENGKLKLAVLIPCYNVQAHIKSVIINLPEVVDLVIAVDDASIDDTATVLFELQKAQNSIPILVHQHKQNGGVGAAMKTAFRIGLESGCEYFVKIDGDGQMDGSFIPKLIEKEGVNFVKGNRFHDFKALRQMPFARRVGNLGLSFLLKAASGYWHIFDPTNGFFAIDRKTLMQLDKSRLANDYFFESSLLLELYYTKAKIKDVAMPAIYGNEVSNLSIWQSLVRFPLKLATAFIRRITFRYFVFDFNIASLYLLIGVPSFLFGVVFGGYNWVYYATRNIPTPLGTIMIATLTVVLGFQLILAAVQFDVSDNWIKK